jgi:hypothetical protein
MMASRARSQNASFAKPFDSESPTLVFLSDDKPDQWPGAETELTDVRRLRSELAETVNPGYFKNPDHLATEVSVAVTGWLRKPRLKNIHGGSAPRNERVTTTSESYQELELRGRHSAVRSRTSSS